RPPPKKNWCPPPAGDPRDFEALEAELLRGRTGVGPFEPSLNAAPSLPQTEKFQILALQQSGVDRCDRCEMGAGDRLPEPIRVARQPDVIVWMQPPMQRSDDLKIPDE